jgi:hypothetical protein
MDCPMCSGPVTLEIGPEQPISAALTDVVLAAEEGERIEITRVCWECGWHEERHLRVESIETTPGDAADAERAALIDTITDELGAIENLATLEDALAEIRRQRRLELSTGDTEEETPRE